VPIVRSAPVRYDAQCHQTYEQRGKGRLQDGQAVAFIFNMFSQLRADDLFIQRMKKLVLTPLAVLTTRDSLIILLQKLQRIRIWGGTSWMGSRWASCAETL